MPAILVAQGGKMLVEVSMPGPRLFAWEAVGEDVGPHRQHLAVNALMGHGGNTVRNWLNQFWKESANLQSVIEMQGTGAGWRMPNDRNAKLGCPRFNGFDDSRWYVVGVDVDGHR